MAIREFRLQLMCGTSIFMCGISCLSVTSLLLCVSIIIRLNTSFESDIVFMESLILLKTTSSGTWNQCRRRVFLPSKCVHGGTTTKWTESTCYSGLSDN